MSSLELGDPLAHRALQALVRAEAAVRRRLAVELERAGVSAAGFSALVVLTTAGGSLELRTLRRRFGWSKANATEVTETLEVRGFVQRHRLPEDRRAVVVPSPARAGPSSTGSSRSTPSGSARPLGALDDGEKRSLAEICRKLAAKRLFRSGRPRSWPREPPPRAGRAPDPDPAPLAGQDHIAVLR